MPGMQTQLNAVINKAGVYDGLSAHYSGEGFSGMRFKFHGLSDTDFDAWVQSNRAAGATLDRQTYMKLEQPSTREPVQRFANVEAGLWSAIVDRCVDGRKMCSSQMMAIDAAGGAGKGGVAGTMRTSWRDLTGERRERQVVAALPTEPVRCFPILTNSILCWAGCRWARSRCRAHPDRHLRRGRPGRHGGARAAHQVPPLGHPVARLAHQHRPQEDRHHVHGAGHRDAAARLCRRPHDACPPGHGLR
ncbi:hypothetical protein Lal_00005355 [Lupinus albus]|nr:hypothetical protein Lal_00005355 [Lupinus albus]